TLRISTLTGHPVRSEFKHPGDIDVLPDADAMIVAPATVNTINKFALGIADTLPLGLLVEGLGKGLPIVAVPYTNAAGAAHPAFAESVAKLRSWGGQVLVGDDVIAFHPPGAGGFTAQGVPWQPALKGLDPSPPAGRPATGDYGG